MPAIKLASYCGARCGRTTLSHHLPKYKPGILWIIDEIVLVGSGKNTFQNFDKYAVQYGQIQKLVRGGGDTPIQLLLGVIPPWPWQKYI